MLIARFYDQTFIIENLTTEQAHVVLCHLYRSSGDLANTIMAHLDLGEGARKVSAASLATMRDFAQALAIAVHDKVQDDKDMPPAMFQLSPLVILSLLRFITNPSDCQSHPITSTLPEVQGSCNEQDLNRVHQLALDLTSHIKALQSAGCYQALSTGFTPSTKPNEETYTFTLSHLKDALTDVLISSTHPVHKNHIPHRGGTIAYPTPHIQRTDILVDLIMARLAKPTTSPEEKP